MIRFKRLQLTCAALLTIHVGCCSVHAQSAETQSEPIHEYAPAKGHLPLRSTAPLTWEGDIARRMIDGAHQFLDRQKSTHQEDRKSEWREALTQANSNSFLDEKRNAIRHQLGLHRDLQPAVRYEVVREISAVDDALERPGSSIRCFHVRWPMLTDPGPRNLVTVWAEGLLLEPEHAKDAPLVVALTDSRQRGEDIVGLTKQEKPAGRFANRLAASGCRVIVPVLIPRDAEVRRGFQSAGGPALSSREFVYRSAFELGQHIIGYEVRSVQSAVSAFASGESQAPVGLIGYGEGARTALYAAALQANMQAVCLSAGFGVASDWSNQPIDRNIFGIANHAEDAELAFLASQHADLILDDANYQPARLAGPLSAPAELARPSEFQSTFEAFQQLSALAPSEHRVVVTPPSETSSISEAAQQAFLTALGVSKPLSPAIPIQGVVEAIEISQDASQRLIEQLDLFHQLMLAESSFSRRQTHQLESLRGTDQLEQYHNRMRPVFSEQVIGKFSETPLPFNARSRLRWESEHWTAYEVVLDVFDNLFAYGVLIVPKDIGPNEKRPVVVCQHGLEGRPADTFLGDHRAYRDFAAKLAERGFITFAPQNIYIFRDDFRSLQRKANPIGKSLFSIMVPQHQQIVDWLSSLEMVDSNRIAFYGLSYGGKSAMRIPALVTDYCLSICSADFNEWVLKNASTRHPFSYVWTGEYEIFEFDLAHTFNYAEMAALIAPRPFMVERGHHDGVGWDEWVAFEYAKIRRLYAQLDLPERTQIEFFNDGHTINGVGTFQFLHDHLDWPEPKPSSH